MKRFFVILGIVVMGMATDAVGQIICGCGLIGKWQLECAFVVRESDNAIIPVSEVKSDWVFGLVDEFIFTENDVSISTYGYEGTTNDATITCDRISLPLPPGILVEWNYKISNGELLLSRTAYRWVDRIQEFYKVYSKYVRAE